MSQRADGQAERAALTGQLLPLLDGPLAERRLADEGGAAGVLQGAGDISLADALPPSTSAMTSSEGSVAAPPGRASVGVTVPSASCSEKTDAGADELAGDVARGGDVAARIAAQIEHDPGHAGGDVGAQRGLQRVGPAIRETIEPDVPDGAIDQVWRDSTSSCWMTSLVISKSERLGGRRVGP